MSERNLGASIRGRLQNYARSSGQDFSIILTRYAIERLLFRLSTSQHAEQFLLKGALLFDLWFDLPHRPTRDADFLGFGSAELSRIDNIFREICAINAEDGMTFDSTTVRAAEIRKDANYAGVRVTFVGTLDGARCPMQVDIGFGDAVTPAPEEVDYPTLLNGFPAPRLRAYPRYTVVAEKFEALTSLGIANSRMKDFFDLWVLARHINFDGDTLRRAVRATFDRRDTPLTEHAPVGLTDKFANDAQKQKQWRAFIGKNKLETVSLADVVALLAEFLGPVQSASYANRVLPVQWPAGGPWSSADIDRG